MITSLNTQLTSQGQWQHIMTTQSSNCGQKGCMPDPFLPFSLDWQFVSNQSVFSDELPGTRPAQDLVGKGGGGLKPQNGTGTGGLQQTNRNSSSSRSNCDHLISATALYHFRRHAPVCLVCPFVCFA